MSLHPQPVPAIPEETARVAQAAFPRDNLYLRMREEVGALFADETFADLFPTRGQPAQAPWRLALVTLMQYVEDLSDRQAADAVRSRIDWKYALSLELTDPGFDSTVLSEFRSRLVAGTAEQRLLEALLDVGRERKWLKARGRQRTDSTSVLARVRAVNRLESVGETLRYVLNTLAVVAPQWVQTHCPAAWVLRYGSRIEDYHLPKDKAERQAYAEVMGADGHALLAALYHPQTPSWLGQLPAVETLRQVWMQQFYQEAGQVRWRTEKEGIPPAAQLINSPYDMEARYAKKHTTSWVGYKVHVTETCDDEGPHLITHVETTAGPVADSEVTDRIHQALEGKGLLPHTHIVDTGYVDATLLVASPRDYGVDLLGPTRADSHWQARAGSGFDASRFHLDWEQQQATCPNGNLSASWTTAINHRNQEVVTIQFSKADCQPCANRADCTRAQRRTLTVRPQVYYEALQEAREREASPDYKAEYARRAGIEGTISQGVRAYGLRRARYFGEAKTSLQHVLTAAAINFVRMGNWLMGKPLAKTRTSAFERVMKQFALC
jgi:transposase